MSLRGREQAWSRIGAALLVLGIGASTGCSTDEGGVHYVFGETGIRSIRVGETDLVEGTGGYYVIGTCDGSDRAETNVTSIDSDGRTLRAPSPACPGAPFQILVEQLDMRSVRTSVTVGPLPADYASLSVPLDVRSEHADTLFTDTGPLFVGGCGEFTRSDQTQLAFQNLPTPCPVGERHTGLAETRRFATVATLSGPRATVERRVVGGDFASMQFYRNQPIDVHNSEISFGPQPRGAILHVSEIITVQ